MNFLHPVQVAFIEIVNKAGSKDKFDYYYHDKPFEELYKWSDLALTRAWAVCTVIEGKSKSGNIVLFYSDWHHKRLIESCQGYTIPVEPLPAEFDLLKFVSKAVRKSGFKNFSVRIIVSRGLSANGLEPDSFPYIKIEVSELNYGVNEPISLWATGKISRNNPEFKSISYIDGVSERELAKSKGYDSILYIDAFKGIKEELVSNIFFIDKTHEPRLITPKLCILHGITRKLVLQIALEDKRLFPGGVDVAPATHISSFDNKKHECFITSTTKGIAPVNKIAGECSTIEFETGPKTITTKLQKKFMKHRSDYYMERGV